ncbi:MAG: glycosyltransferase [Deltaproteobacteria bacterium]|jgi:glycosyltransferase involved in cell wall biosynthesis|nr:glycosyltransferase [Deltaproteobacteria bacterium]
MKICFFNSTNVWGGGEKWHLDTALACLKDGHEVRLVGNYQSELLARASDLNLKTKAFKLTNLSFLNPFKFLKVFLFLKQQKFDVIILNFSKDLKIAAPSARLAGTARIIYRRGLAIPIKNTSLNRWLFKNCLDDILVNSLATKKSILQNNPKLFPENKIKVIYNGVELEQFKPSSYAVEINSANCVILNLGRCVFQKGQDLLIKIAAILKQRGVNCQVKIGGAGVLLPVLKKQAEELGVSDRVEFMGLVSNSAEFLTNSGGGGIFALTSRWEGFGYVLAEAMACQLPLVAFNVSSNPELISDGENGYLVEAYNLEAFADKLQTLIQNPQLCSALGKRGRQFVEKKFEASKNMQEVLEYIKAPF